MSQLSIYKIGQGYRAIYKKLEEFAENQSQTTKVLMPNRSIIKSFKEDLLRDKGGLLGLDFVTFDDLAQTYCLRKIDDKKEILPYLFQERLKARRQTYKDLGPSFDFLATIQSLIGFFNELRLCGLGEDQFKSLPYLYREDLKRAYLDYEALLDELAIQTLEEAYRASKENIQKGLFPGEKLLVFGFSSFRPIETDLLSAFMRGGFDLDIHLGFGKQGEGIFEDTIRSLEEIGLRPCYIEETTGGDLAQFVLGQNQLPSLNLEFVQGQDETSLVEDIFNSLMDKLDQGFDIDKMAIICSDKTLQEDLIKRARLYEIPLSNPLNRVQIDQSPLLQELECLLTFGKEGGQAFRQRLLLKLFPIHERGEDLERILSRYDFEDLDRLVEGLKSRVSITMKAEDQDLVYSCLDLFIQDRDRYRVLGLGPMISTLEGLLDSLDPKGLSGQDPQIYQHLKDICQDLGPYRGKLENLEARDFLDILFSYLKRKEADGRDGVRGLSILSLQEAYALEFSHIFVYNMTSDFPHKNKEDFLVNRQTIEGLQGLGLYLDYRDRYQMEGLMFYSVLAGSEGASLYQLGQEEDLSPLWIELKSKLIQARERKILTYSLEKSYNWSRSHQTKGKKSPCPPFVLGDQALDAILEELRERSYNATFIDSYIACPFRSLVEGFLLERDDLYEESSQTNMAIGTIYHETLEEFYRSKKSLEDLGEVFENHVNKGSYYDIFEKEEFPLLKKLMLKNLRAFIEVDQDRLTHEKKDLGFSPEEFEVKFSCKIAGVNWRGSIDRIDKNSRGQEVLIDYKKSTGPSVGDFAKGATWQLAIYAYSRYLQGAEVVGFAYGNIGGKNFRYLLRNVDQIGSYLYASEASQKMTDEGVAEFFQGLEGNLETLIQKLEGGDFSAIPLEEKRCIYCRLSDICRKEEIR